MKTKTVKNVGRSICQGSYYYHGVRILVFYSDAGTGGAMGATGPPNICQIS